MLVCAIMYFLMRVALHHFCSAVEQFIRAKYERKQYISRGGSSEPSSSKQATTSEPKAKSKAKKASSSTAPQKPSTEQVSELAIALVINGHTVL